MVRNGSLASSRRTAIRLMTVDPQALLAHHHAVQLRFGNTAASAAGTGQVRVR